MKKTMLKRMLAITVCTAALAGIYGGPVYAAELWSGTDNSVLTQQQSSPSGTVGEQIKDLNLGNVQIDGTNGSITIKGQKIETDTVNNIYVHTGLHTTGQITVDDNLSVSKNAIVKGTLAVGTDGGLFTVGETGAISAAGGKFNVGADGAITTELKVNEKATLNNGLEITGGTKTDTLTVTRDSKLNGKLEVDGTFSTAGGNFYVDTDGATDIAANLTVKDDATIGKDLTVKGDSYLQGKLEVTDKATLKGGLEVTGGTTTDTLTVTGDSKLNGKLDVAKDATVGGKLDVAGDIISGGDVKIKDTNAKEIKLSDLGHLGDLDEELAGNQQYLDNPTAVGAFNAEAAIRRGEIARLDNRIDELDTRVNKVGAMAAAIASLKSIGYSPEAPTEFSVGVGQYKGKTGIALGFFHYPNKDFMLNFSLSSSSGEMMGGIGATWRFGKAKG